jgi:hypothetical protein
MKSVRNNLLKYDIFFNDNKKASWTYIEAFYASDKSKPLRLAPKLTNIIDYRDERYFTTGDFVTVTRKSRVTTVIKYSK